MMKCKYLLIAISLCFVSAYCNAQRIVMKIAAITAKDGEEVRALEFKINAVTTYLNGGGVSVGKAVPGSLIVKKSNDVSTSTLFKNIAQGKSFPEVIFEFYDASKTLYYTITLTGAFVDQMYWLSPECPTCLKLEHQVGFVFKTYKTLDVITGVTTIWDISTNILQ